MIIKKGTHAPFRFPCLVTEARTVFLVSFTESCKYEIGDDQSDINKLFGVGHFPHHHKNSVRFGWRWVPDLGKIEVLAYYYIDGKRMDRHMVYVEIGERLVYEINGEGNFYSLIIHGSTYLDIPLKPCKVGYLLQTYFGGNQTAPHDIEIEINKA